MEAVRCWVWTFSGIAQLMLGARLTGNQDILEDASQDSPQQFVTK